MNNDIVLKNKFKSSFRWNLMGSIIYESIKNLHYFLLLSVFDVSFYGLVGSIFALIYFSVKIADAGTTYLLPPFFHLLTKNRKNFKKLFLVYFLLPQIPIMGITTWLATVIFYKKFTTTAISPLWLFIFPALIIIETLRSFLRYLLHFSFKSRLIILIEIPTFILYVSSIWLLIYPRSNGKLSLNSIFFPHLIESSCVVLFFVVLTFFLYRSLPLSFALSFSGNLWKRTLETRFFNHLLRISRDLFTSNFITPLFALKFGFGTAGIFFFVGSLATSLQMIIKAVLNYSGYALFAQVKERTHHEKKEAFLLLSEKLLKIIAPIIIFLLINCRIFVRLGEGYKTGIGFPLSLFFIFLGIICMEFFQQLYEQFYILEEASKKLFFLRMFEFVMLYFFVILFQENNPNIMLLRIAFIRFIGLTIIAINAYFTWKIKLSLRINVRYIASCVVFSGCFSTLYHLFF